MSAGEAEGRLLDALQNSNGLAARTTGPGRIHVARTYRPRWAVVLAVLTAPLVGLGLLFLLVKRTESGEVVVVDGPTGCVVALPTMLTVAVVDSLRAALDAPSLPTSVAGSPHAAGMPAPPSEAHRLIASPPGMPVPAAAAPVPGGSGVDESVDDLDGRTIARPSTPAPTSPHASRVSIRFDSGEVVSVPVGQRLAIGRAPSGPGSVVVPGESRSVSKTHLALEFDGSSFVVEDLHSTNGSCYESADGGGALPAGQPVRIQPDATLTMGDVTVALVRG